MGEVDLKSWHASGRLVPVGGRRLHVVDVGEGPPVLLLHGFLHASWTWRRTIAALARTHRVIAPDLPGAGWSDRGGDLGLEALTGAIRDLQDGLGVGPFELAVGNSLGGAVLLRLLLEEPARARRLALVSSLGPRLNVPDLPLAALRASLLEPLFRFTAGNPAFVRRALGLLAYRRVPVCDEVLDGFRPLARPGSHIAACDMARGVKPGTAWLEPRLSGLAVPASILWGAGDRVLPLRYGRTLAGLLRGADLEVWDDCGHCPQEEDPARFEAWLRARLPARLTAEEPEARAAG